MSKVKRNEEEPDAKFIRGTPEHYKVAEILDKRIINRKTEYKIRWYGFKEDSSTWEPAKMLDRTNDLKEMKRKYNEDN